MKMICEQCLKSYSANPKNIKKNIHNFCSKPCYSAWMKEHRDFYKIENRKFRKQKNIEGNFLKN
jgi:hypothetical protein